MQSAQISPVTKFVDPAVFVYDTMTWGLKETFDFKNNWTVPQHDRQHGLDDGRSESLYILSGVTEALFTGDPLTAAGRFFSLFPDVIHSVNLVRHSEGQDLMKGGPIKIELPSFVEERLKGQGEMDVQSLKFQFSPDKGMMGKALEMTSNYNSWLLINRTMNFKMFPNGAGRMAEMMTGLGLTIVGSLVANKDGANTETFDVVRGYMEAGIGLGSLAAGVVDILVTEDAKDDTPEGIDHNEFIAVKTTSETSLKSILTAFPRYIARAAAHMHNDNKIIEKLAELNEPGSEEALAAFQADEKLQTLLTGALRRKENSSALTNTFRSVAGSVIGDFKELKDHFGDVWDKMKTSDSAMAVLFRDIKSAPTRYAGAMQLATAQLLLPLAAYTMVGGAASAETPAGKVGFVLAGAAMAGSWFFKHRGCAAKTRMSLRGITINGDNGPAPEPTP